MGDRRSNNAQSTAQVAQPVLAEPRVVRMPNADDPAIMGARRRATEQAKRRRGRLSTILSDALNGSMGRLGA